MSNEGQSSGSLSAKIATWATVGTAVIGLIAATFTLGAEVLDRAENSNSPEPSQVNRSAQDHSASASSKTSTTAKQTAGQSPSTPIEVIKVLDEQTDGADVAYSDYTTVKDETGALSVEVPTAWSDVRSGTWRSTTDHELGPQVYAARNVDRFFTDGQVESVDGESGVLLQASEAAIPGYGVKETLDIRETDYDNVCGNYEGRYPLRFSTYTGQFIAFSSCGVTGDSWLILIVAEPNDLNEDYQGGLLQITIKGVGRGDVEAAERVLNSFNVSGL